MGHHRTEVALLISLFLEKVVTLLSPGQMIVHVSTQVPVSVLCLFYGHSWVLGLVSALAALWSSPHWSGGVWSTKVLGQFPVFPVIIISDNGDDGRVIRELLLLTVCWEGKEETCQDCYILGNLGEIQFAPEYQCHFKNFIAFFISQVYIEHVMYHKQINML